jgi:predicted HAD superfamily phosphohydrolase YqeG
MYVLKNDKTLFLDVDNTLVTWHDQVWTGNEKYISLVKQFHERGQAVVVWSAGGWSWATRVVCELGLEAYVTAVLSKPTWFADDLPASDFMPENTRIYFKE